MDLNLYLKQLEELVNIDSGSHNAVGINCVADRLESWYRELGWNVESIFVGEETGRVLLITNRPADHYDVMYVGHMDTVFPDGTAAARPFRMDGENYYGPGVGDMKNGDVAMYHIAANLPKEVNDKLNIAMVYNPDEEIGSVYSKGVLDSIGRKAAHIFVMESAGQKGARHCFARKGSLCYDIEFHGQAAHAGFMFEVPNASAVLEMGNYIVKLMGLASKDEDTTVNVGVANGGTARNVVADYAKLSVEMRFKKESEYKRLKAAVHEMVGGAPFVEGVKAEIAMERETAPFVKTEKALAYMECMKAVAESLEIPFMEKDRGGLSDANHLAAASDAIVVDGMGPHGALDHSEKEYGYIGSVEPCVRLHLGLLAELAGRK
ncbi:MAG: M20/M25/M40 family metallo-hydrolase [Lachnospiraceae bacterium]|nr:M20/M25/M40 family metallo-hydrolase [Lachnospiraceae bacterium]